ncbi:MAG TPA: hypothetical protein VHL98_03365 [Microvirga sp.]|jgi:hypothetical protein|nr:hypothetical protein [Microvirga sp.]
MRLLLLIAVIALGADALLHNGAYTQRAWRTVSHEASRLVAGADATVDAVDRKADRRS